MEQNAVTGIKEILIGDGGHYLFHLLVPSILLNGQKIRSYYRQQSLFSYRLIGYKTNPLPGGFFNPVWARPFKIRCQRLGQQLLYGPIAAKHHWQPIERI